MQVRESRRRDLARLVTWYPLRWKLRLLPIPLAVRSLRGLGRLHARLRPGLVRELAERFRKAGVEGFGEAWRLGEARRYLREHYVDRLQVFLFPRLARKGRWRRILRTQGTEHIWQAQQGGKGCILVFPHYGPIQLPLFALAEEGFRLLQIARLVTEGFSWVGRKVALRLRVKLEAHLPVDFVQVGSYMRPVLRHLKGGGVVMITGDGAVAEPEAEGHLDMLFLKSARRFPLGPAALAKMSGAPLVPCFLVPDKEGMYKLIVGRPLELDRDRQEVTYEDVRAFVQVMERLLHRWPGHWHFWDQWNPETILDQETTEARIPRLPPDLELPS